MQKPQGRKPRQRRTGDVTYPADMQEQRKEPDALGHDMPKPPDAPPASVPMDVGKPRRVTPKD